MATVDHAIDIFENLSITKSGKLFESCQLWVLSYGSDLKSNDSISETNITKYEY